MGDRHWFVLYVLVCLEVGIFLVLVPWSVIWERNYFLEAYPALRPFLLDPWLRGAVSGLGVANIYLVLHEVVGRRRQSALSSTGLFPGGLRLAAERDRSEVDCSEESGAESSESAEFVTHDKQS